MVVDASARIAIVMMVRLHWMRGLMDLARRLYQRLPEECQRQQHRQHGG
jgi:hypothetical protein